MSRHRLLALIIVIVAFAMRMYALDMVWHDFDRSYPHGLAIETLESLQDGQFQDPAPRNYISTIGMPNPLAAVYLWMLVGVFDRSAYAATAISVMLNVLAVAMTFDLARRLFGRSPAVVAALLAATSPWAIFIARGTYVQGLLEFSAVASAWLVITALKRGNGRQLIAGFAVTAVVIHTYAVALALIVQVAAVVLAAWPSARKLVRPILFGFGLLAFSVFVQIAPFTLLRDADSPAPDAIATMGGFPVQSESIPNPFGIHLNLSGIDHALRIVSGRDFENEQLYRNAPDFAWQESIGDTRATLVDVLLLIGIVVAVARSRRDAGSRMTLVWFLVPTLTATLLMAVFTTLHTTYYYMTIASPAGYLLAALPFTSIDWLVRRWTAQPRWGISARVGLGSALVLAALGQVSISGSHLVGHIANVQLQPSPHNWLFSPLRWQMTLGDIWRAQCIEINDGLPRYWLISILQSARSLRDGTARTNGQSEVWAVGERGGNCTTRSAGSAPPLATPTRVHLSDRVQVDVYRSLPLSPTGPVFAHDEPAGDPTLQSIPGTNISKLLNGDGPLRVNLNWTLIDLAAPATAQPGDWVTISQAWRVDALPEEPHWNWYFAPFVTLSSETDQALVTVDNAPALEGWMWRPGDIILSTVRLQVPADTAPGHYKLQSTLFDPNQKKNAVFFAPDAPDKPILVLERTLTIKAPPP